MPFVKRSDGPDLHYTVTDFTDPWLDAPVLFLQHGYGRNSRFWYEWVPTLSRHFKVITPDMRGQGRSPATFDLQSGFTLDSLSADVIAIADDLGVKRFHYCGESIGGLIGLAVGGNYPDRLLTLTNVSGPVFISDGARVGYALGTSSWPDAIRELGPREWLIRTNASTRFPPDFSQDFLDWYTDSVETTGAPVLAALAQFALDADARPLLPKITAPVLCIYPKQGAIANTEQQNTIRQHVRNVSISEVETTYHMVQHIVPQACIDLLQGHISAAV